MIQRIDEKTDKRLYAPEAEMSVLGGCINEHRVIPDVIEILNSGDFAEQDHPEIFEAIIQLWNENKRVDLVLLNEMLIKQGKSIDVQYIVTIAESSPIASNAPYYAKAVKEASQKRQLWEAADSIKHRLTNDSDDVTGQIDTAESAIFKIAQRTCESQSSADLPTLLHQEYELFENGGLEPGIPTGFAEIDYLTSGLRSGELIIIAARPSMGKTTLAVNIAEDMSIKQNIPVAFFSMEMSKESIAHRIMCSQSMVSLNRMRRNKLTEHDFNQLSRTIGRLSNTQFYVEQVHSMTPTLLRAKARRLKRKYGIRVIVIDYLQLMTIAGNQPRHEKVGEITRSLKGLAGELGVPILCLSQLNRGNEGREDKRPRMSDIRESGSVEQDADMIMMIHRESYYHKADEAWLLQNEAIVNRAEVIMEKNRNGQTGVAYLHFSGETTKFTNWAERGNDEATY